MTSPRSRPPIRGGHLAISVLLTASVIALGWRHVSALEDRPGWFTVVFCYAFALLAAQLGLAWTHRFVRPPRRERPRLRAVVVVPLFNEDPDCFRRALDSLAGQSRPPAVVHVVDDGSTSPDCELVWRDFHASHRSGVTTWVWTSQANAGKRHAQAVAFRAHRADVFVTMDSDTVLDGDALLHLLAPFQQADVTAVGALLMGLNSRRNLLTRLVDLGFTLSFLNGRAAWSRLGSVAVNCGGLAAYRADVVVDNLDHYLTQTVLGAPANCGDDRMLTGYALLAPGGRTVVQNTAVGYTLLPDRMSHLQRQRVRWWRSWFFGGVWLLGACPMNRLVWWLVCFQFVSFALFTLVLPLVLLVGPVVGWYLPWEALAYIGVLGYVRALPYLSLRRPDETALSRWVTFALAPASALLHLYLCSVLQYVGLMTMRERGWSTRSAVEVSA